MFEESDFSIFEDQEDYIEDIKEQLSQAIRRYTLYCKMFGKLSEWKYLKDDVKRFMHYELERNFKNGLMKETSDGMIIMKFEEKDM